MLAAKTVAHSYRARAMGSASPKSETEKPMIVFIIIIRYYIYMGIFLNLKITK